MQFGIAYFPTDTSLGAVELGRACEAAGFESIWFPEHTHLPVGTALSGDPTALAIAADRRAHILDPFVALGAVAAATTRLKLGTGICLVVQRDPITCAKEVATLDLLSGGRVLFGIGGGYVEGELRNHGTNPATRWALLRERVQAMRRIWTEDAAEFHGRHVDFGPIWSWPKPVQKPHPPIILGGNGPRTLQRVVAYADGWMPILGGPSTFGTIALDGLRSRIRELQRLAEAAGRQPIPVTIYGPRPERVLIEQVQEAGVDRCLFLLASGPAEKTLPALERCAQLAAAFA